MAQCVCWGGGGGAVGVGGSERIRSSLWWGNLYGFFRIIRMCERFLLWVIQVTYNGIGVFRRGPSGLLITLYLEFGSVGIGQEMFIGFFFRDLSVHWSCHWEVRDEGMR